MKSKNLIESFTFAIRGLLYALRNERNMRIHLSLGLLVVLIGVALELTRLEMAILIALVGLVIGLELVNTAVENVVDLVTSERHPLAEVAKNVAAGAVLVAAAVALIAGYLLFFERIASLHPAMLARTVMMPIYVPLIGFTIVIALVVAIKALGAPFHLQGGMPSGHAAVAFGLAVAIFFLSESGAPVILGAGLALLVAQSRVEGNIHSVAEVVLGALLGASVVATVFISLAR